MIYRLRSSVGRRIQVRLVAREPLPFENFAPRKDEMSDHEGPTNAGLYV